MSDPTTLVVVEPDGGTNDNDSQNNKTDRCVADNVMDDGIKENSDNADNDHVIMVTNDGGRKSIRNEGAGLTPHDVFCEMEELYEDDYNAEWRQIARWVKFEEDVEEGGERWSKPHVASLQLRAIHELKDLLSEGIILLHTDANDFENVVDLVVNVVIEKKKMGVEHRRSLRNVLLLRHRHLYQRQKHIEEDANLPSINTIADPGAGLSMFMALAGAMAKPESTAVGLDNPLMSDKNTEKQENDENVTESHKGNMQFFKKIPEGSEAANILIGEVEFLKQTVAVFLRLNRSHVFGDITEVPIKTRFIFILLGPLGKQAKFREIGRCMSTLMSEEIFNLVAYRAESTKEFLDGIDMFLTHVTVLPPGEWDPSIRLEPPKTVQPQTAPPDPDSESQQVPEDGKTPVMEEEEDMKTQALKRTGRLFGGLVRDIRRKIPYYVSDFKDALSLQCIASFIFLYFAYMAQSVTFGGLLSDATGTNMAVFESIIASTICGLVYHLFSGQPLIILGNTGPVLVFESILFQFCKDYDLDYLQFRLWVGVWTGIILLIIVAFDLSSLIQYITRFTEEGFAFLISAIFIQEAFTKLYNIIKVAPIHLDPSSDCWCEKLPKNNTLSNSSNSINISEFISTTPLILSVSNGPNATSDVERYSLSESECIKHGGELAGNGCGYVADVLLMSVILFFGTYIIAMALKQLRNSRLFPNIVRSKLSDFAVVIAIGVMIGLDAGMRLPTPKLEVPENFAPTKPGRGWIVNPIGKNPWWTIFAAVIPAMLATILIFLGQQISGLIINRKENKLEKGYGYHLDLLVVASLIILNSFLGLPFFIAATVLCINHVVSLKKEETNVAPGTRPKFLGIREQRLTGVTIFICIGLSILLTKILKVIPMPVLYGVFLYMGVASLKGMQLVDRIFLFFIPPKYQPDHAYLRHVPLLRVHLFTGIQVFYLVCLWVIKSIKEIAIAFPLMVLAMCFVRKAMDCIFTQKELEWLDDVMPGSKKADKEDNQNIHDIEMRPNGNPDLEALNSGKNCISPKKKNKEAKDKTTSPSLNSMFMSSRH